MTLKGQRSRSQGSKKENHISALMTPLTSMDSFTKLDVKFIALIVIPYQPDFNLRSKVKVIEVNLLGRDLDFFHFILS